MWMWKSSSSSPGGKVFHGLPTDISAVNYGLNSLWLTDYAIKAQKTGFYYGRLGLDRWCTTTIYFEVLYQISCTIFKRQTTQMLLINFSRQLFFSRKTKLTRRQTIRQNVTVTWHQPVEKSLENAHVALPSCSKKRKIERPWAKSALNHPESKNNLRPNEEPEREHRVTTRRQI